MNSSLQEPGTGQKEFMGKSVRWWQRAGGGALALAIIVHLVFAIVATYYVVQSYMSEPPPKPPAPSSLQRDDSRKVAIDIRQKSMSSPAIKKKIVTTANSPVALPEMPDIPTENLMPSLMPGVANTFGTGTGTGGGGGGGGGGLRNTTFFGTPGAKEGLIGTFYDFKQNSSRNEVTNNFDIYREKVGKFVESGWKPSVLNEYYKVRNAVASSMIFIPNIDAELGPRAFNVGNRVQPRMWLVHYQATVVPPVSGTYRFIGAGDDVMLAAIDGKLVLDRCWNVHIMDMPDNLQYGYTGIPGGFGRGVPFTVVAGKEYKLDIAIGEMPGGKLFGFLFIEKEGEEPKVGGNRNLPIFPVFRVANVELPAVPAGTELPPFDESVPPWSVWKSVQPKRAGGLNTGDFFRQH